MSEKRPKIWMFDFDKTIARGGKFPEPGEPIWPVVNYIRAVQEKGDQWILWTNREGDALDIALKWLDEHGLHPDTVNDNLPQMKEFFKGNPRKPFANVTVDDLNAGGLYLPPLDGGMDFGCALHALKAASRVRRKAWPESEFLFMADSIEFHTDADIGALENVDCQTEDCLCLKDDTDCFRPGWTPSQEDLLSDDWEVLDDVDPLAHAGKDDEKQHITVPPKGDKSTPMSWDIALAVMHDGGRVRRDGWPPDKYYRILRKDGVKAEGCHVGLLTEEATDLSKGGELTLCCVVNEVVVPGWLAPSSKDDLEGWLRAD